MLYLLSPILLSTGDISHAVIFQTVHCAENRLYITLVWHGRTDHLLKLPLIYMNKSGENFAKIFHYRMIWYINPESKLTPAPLSKVNQVHIPISFVALNHKWIPSALNTHSEALKSDPAFNGNSSMKWNIFSNLIHMSYDQNKSVLYQSNCHQSNQFTWFSNQIWLCISIFMEILFCYTCLFMFPDKIMQE